MKKFIICISILIVIISAFAACNKNQAEGEATSSTASAAASSHHTKIDDNYSTTAPQHTVGGVQTSEKFGDGKEYYINYYDENGHVAKVEIYESGKMAYYYVVVATDELGNSVQQKYYTPSGTFVATYDNTFFFDSSGNKITETEFEKRLGR